MRDESLPLGAETSASQRSQLAGVSARNFLWLGVSRGHGGHDVALAQEMERGERGADREESGVLAARAVIVPVGGGLLLPVKRMYRLWMEEHNLYRGFKTSLHYCLLHVPRRVHLRVRGRLDVQVHGV